MTSPRQLPAFLSALPLALPARRPFARPICPTCTLSLAPDPVDLPRPARAPRAFHSEETKRKIGQAVLRRAALRRERLHHFVLSVRDSAAQSSPSPSSPSEDSDPDPDPNPVSDAPPPPPRKPRRRLSAESRAKISAALKGRRKSASHREALRARFEGDGNPMYGRKLSDASRAKISAAMSGRARARRRRAAAREAADHKRVQPPSARALSDLREKAERSRLLAEGAARPDAGRRRKREKERALQDQAEAQEIDQLLRRVAGLLKPPENVVRTLENTRKRKEEGSEEQAAGEEKTRTCHMCQATGFVKCPECVGAFGVASARCELCFGAGAVFCEACQGVGELNEGGVC